jgi:glycosyltransferase involved in cell wall biosynthesis
MFWLLGKELTLAGHEVVAITSDGISESERSASLTEVLPPGIHVKRFPNRYNRLANRFGPLFFRPQGMKRDLIDEASRADVVHVGERAIHCEWAAQACSETGTPMVWSPYGGLATATGARGMFRRYLRTRYLANVIPTVSACIAQTSHERDSGPSWGLQPDRIRMIPLCVDWAEFQDLPTRGSFRRTIGIDPSSQLIVTMSRLHPAKGTDILIEAFSRVPTSDQGPYLAIVGWDDGLLSRLRSLVSALHLEDRVRFVHPLYGADRIQAFVDADVFSLTPRFYEETSLAALEAAACGTATFVTVQCEVPGLSEASAGLVGRLDVDEISTGLTNLLADEPLRRAIGNRARALVQDQLTAPIVARAHEQLFQELVARHHRNEFVGRG